MLIIRKVKSQTPASLLTWPVTADLMSPPRVWVFGTTGAHDTSTCPVELPDRAPSPPSVGPMGRRLASLTLPEPELLRHDAALTILPCQLLWPAVSYLPFGASPLFAWLPARLRPSSPENPSVDRHYLTPEPTQTQPTQQQHLENSTHLSHSLHLRECEWQCEMRTEGGKKDREYCVLKIWASTTGW